MSDDERAAWHTEWHAYVGSFTYGISEQEREKITTAVNLAIGGRGWIADDHIMQAERVYRQVIIPLLRQCWDIAYGAGRDDEAQGLGLPGGHDYGSEDATGNPYEKG